MRLDKNLAKYYYTAAQARERLGLDEQGFQYWIRKGRINKITLPGRTQGVYSRKEVDNMVNQIEIAIITEQPKETDFREATIEDIEQEAELAALMFGEKAAAVAERKAFLKTNPHIDYHLYDQGKLVAYINIIPLKHQAIMEFIEGRKIIWHISTEDIEQFEPGKPVECLIADMATTPTVPPIKRTQYGERLLLGVLGKLAEMGTQGIEITKTYAGSGTKTPSGLRILKKAGFEVIYEREPINDRGERKTMFALDMQASEERILKEYQEAIKQWKELQTEKANTKPKKSKQKVLS